MRNKFDEQLDRLNIELIEMGSICEKAINDVIQALKNGDKVFAKKIMEVDTLTNQKEREIEDMCLKMLLRQQPVAKDLRQISSALKMITDLERIGDQASDIAEIITVADICIENTFPDIIEMAKASKKMVTESIDAFVSNDLELASSVIAYDDVVDSYFNDIKTELIDLIRNDAGDGEFAMDLLMIAKYLERIGDHATNVSEWVEFSITGRHNKLEDLN